MTSVFRPVLFPAPVPGMVGKNSYTYSG